MKATNKHTVPIEYLITELKSDMEKGLSSEEAKTRFEKFGGNIIQSEKGKHLLKILIEQLNSLLVYLLLFAAGLSFWFQEYLDATAILLVILINTVIGFWMELQAQRSMNTLKKMASVPSKVYRAQCNKYCYNKVFILDRLPLTNDYARLEDEKEQIRIHNLIIKVYQSFPCPIVHVPVLPPDERVEFILKNL